MGATGREMHIDKVLTNMALGYRPEGFIADRILPTVEVQKQTDLYTVFDRGDRMRRQDTKRTPGAEAHLRFEDVGSDTYHCSNYALKDKVTIEDRSNADPFFITNLLNAKTELLLDDLMLDEEVRVASLVTTTTNVGSFNAVSSAWNGAGDPIGDINTTIDNVHYANGVMPNRVVFGIEAWKSFRRDSTIRNLIFGTNNGGGYPNTAQVAQLLDIDEVLVGGSFQNTAQKNQTESLSTIWGENVLVHYSPSRPSIQRPSFGYRFRWVKSGLPNRTVERHPYDTRKKAEEVEVGYYQDEKVTTASYGHLLVAVNSST